MSRGDMWWVFILQYDSSGYVQHTPWLSEIRGYMLRDLLSYTLKARIPYLNCTDVRRGEGLFGSNF